MLPDKRQESNQNDFYSFLTLCGHKCDLWAIPVIANFALYKNVTTMADRSRYDFGQWPLDLLVDYVLKVHHRGVRSHGPGTLALIGNVRQ